MTETKLINFLCENEIEICWEEEELLVFLLPHELRRLGEMLSVCCFDDGGIPLIWRHNYVVLDLVPICEYYEIDPEKVFSKETKDEASCL